MAQKYTDECLIAGGALPGKHSFTSAHVGKFKFDLALFFHGRGTSDGLPDTHYPIQVTRENPFLIR